MRQPGSDQTRLLSGTSRVRTRALLAAGLVVVSVVVTLGTLLITGRLPSAAHDRVPDSAHSAIPSSPNVTTASRPAAHGGSGASLRDVDGGPNYYAKFSSPLPSDPSFFPIAVWFEGVLAKTDVDKDRDAGLNTYLELTDNSKMDLVRDGGMYAIRGNPGVAGPETVGWLLSDEADMWAGPGDAIWTGRYPGHGPICNPPGAKCGYTVQQTVRKKHPADGRLRYAQYGKGVVFWETDEQARRFVNEFQDVLSADTYWLTDENLCGRSEGASLFDPKMLGPDGRLPAQLCHRATNYGKTIDRVRSLVTPPASKPVWGFVELGHPASQDGWPTAKPDEAVAAVWSSLIHGARGIVYFNHSFGGACKTQHVLRDSCYQDMRAAVKQLNSRIKELAPVLNAKVADGVVTASAGVDVSTKWYDGNFYVLAGSNQAASQNATLTLPCVGDAKVTVLDENRSMPVINGAFRDRFADGNAVHIYRIDGGSSCGAY
jgi:hypothetical protein